MFTLPTTAGTTETCGKIAMSLLEGVGPGDRIESHLDTITTTGRPFRLIGTRIVADDGAEISEGAPGVGEVQVRGAAVFRGYWGRERDAGVFTGDGWFRTGDLAEWRGDGYIQVVDRLKDMLLVGGENVYPTELENVLAAHPAVQQAAVIGVPNAVLGELPHACVTLRPAFQGARAPPPAQLLAHCRAQLSGYKVPVAVHVLESFPVTGSGKVQKRALREQMLARLGVSTESAAAAAASSAKRVGGAVPKSAAASRRLEMLVWKEDEAEAQQRGTSQPGQRWLVLEDGSGVARRAAMAGGAHATLVNLHAKAGAADAAAALKAALVGAEPFDRVVVALPLDWLASVASSTELQQQVACLKVALRIIAAAESTRSATAALLTRRAESAVSPAAAEALAAGWAEEGEGRLRIELPEDASAAVIAAAAREISSGSNGRVALQGSVPEVLRASYVSVLPQQRSDGAAPIAALLGLASCLVVSGDWQHGSTVKALAAELIQAPTVRSVLLLQSGSAQLRGTAATSAAVLALEGAAGKRVIISAADPCSTEQLRMALRAACSGSFALLRVVDGGSSLPMPDAVAAERSALVAAFSEGDVRLETLLSVTVGSAGAAAAYLTAADEQLGACRACFVQLRKPLVVEQTKETREILSALAAAPGARCFLSEPMPAGEKQAAAVELPASSSTVPASAPPAALEGQETAAAASEAVKVSRKVTDVLRQQIREAISAVLDLDVADLQDDVELWQSGLSSTLAVSASAQIQAAVGVDLPATLLFDYPTVLGLLSYVTDAVRREEARSNRGPQRAAGSETLRASSSDDEEGRSAGEEAAVAEAVRAAVLDVLQIESGGAELTAESSLWDFGLSSNAAVGIAGALERALGCAMPATLVFDYGTVAELTAYVLPIVAGSSGGGSLSRKVSRRASSKPAVVRQASVRSTASDRVVRRTSSRPSGGAHRKIPAQTPRSARKRLAGIIGEVAGKLLGVDAVEPNETLWSLGLNSLGAVQLSQALGSALQMELPATLR